TARTEEVDRIIGLSVGADDYITKPFSPREVVARGKAVLRRRRPEPDTARPDAQTLRFPALSLDATRRGLQLDGALVTLSTLEFDILWALAEAPGRVYSRMQLLEKVWGYDFYGDERVVDVHIRNIRKALDDDAAAPRFVGTVRGVGYKFLPEPDAGGDS